jgi:hypothetical protein
LRGIGFELGPKLLRKGRGRRRVAAWAAVEPLVATRDSVLLNALAVGLLEGHSPKRHLELMGARTRALHDHP